MSNVKDTVWEECCGILSDKMDGESFNTHIKTTLSVFDIETHVLWIGFSNPYSLELVEELVGKQIHAFMQERSIEAKLVVATLEELEHAAIGKHIDPPANGAELLPLQEHLFSLERKGRIRIYPISAQREFPKLLTRIPIFMPGHRASQHKILDPDLALPFENAWAKGRKFGPPLSVYDEDTLIALSQMRQNSLTGEARKLPVPISELQFDPNQSDASVHTVICTAKDLEQKCRDARGGMARTLRVDSVRRLSAVKIEIVSDVGRGRTVGTTFDLINVLWERFEDDATFYVQFSPLMTTWLKTEFSYVDPEIRFNLKNDMSKALYRFLSGQRKEYAISVKKLMSVIGYSRAPRRFLGDVKLAAQLLVEIGFLSNYEVTGNGKGTEHILRTIR